MQNHNNSIENLFQKHQNTWDIQELNSNHKELFLSKLQNKKFKRNIFIPLAVAASLLLIVGI